MWLSCIIALFLVAGLSATASAHGNARHDHRISLLIIDPDSYLVNTAVKSLNLPDGIRVQFFIHDDLKHNREAQRFVAESDVIIVDVMGPDLVEWLQDHLDPEVNRVYALRGSRDDDALRRRGFIFDESIMNYFNHLATENIRNLIYRVINREIDQAVNFAPVVPQPKLGIYHPDAEAIFETSDKFQKWYRQRSGYQASDPWVGIMLYSASLMEGQCRAYDYLVRQLEREGLNVMACFGREREVIGKLLLDEDRKARVEAVISFSLKFYSAIDDNLRRDVANLNVPILNAINLYSSSIDDWRQDPIGIQPLEIAWNIAVPEMSGAIEPTPLAGKILRRDEENGKTVFEYHPIEETVSQITSRIKGWLRLRRKTNAQKRLAIIYYNHSQGKQNISASYLNVFRSLEAVLARLQKEGYRTGDGLSMSEADIQAAVMRSGRNIGSWAPGELADLVADGQVVRLPLDIYKKWFEALPETFRRAVVAQWGPPEEFSMMVQDGQIIIPAVVLGNLVMLPEPSRGWTDAPMKLYHDTTLFPHHQYIAAYLWLKHGFAADAMIHLGTHATHEWLPGKQAGLAPSDSPEVLLTDIPNIYPYIVDNIGEGLQAKRRGRGVVIDHLIPPFKPAGLYHEYAELLEMINAYNQAAAMGSDTAAEQLRQLGVRIRDIGIDMDLHTVGDHSHPEKVDENPALAGHRHTGQVHQHARHDFGHRHVGPDGRLVVDAALVHELEHYLLEVKASLMPYGLHTFGHSPDGPALDDMVAAIVDAHPEQTAAQIERAISASGPREMDHLVRALDGGFIPPAEGNDPVRNIKAIPTGNNFYGFSPDKVPSRAAWEMGKQAAQQIIDKHLSEKGSYPQKVAVVLWATETIRNEGINESTILYLLGLAPQWDRTGRITGVRVIAGPQLKRPRIDVLVNPSGLYRDLFPHMMRFIDNAIRTAAVQTDVENLIAAHTGQIKDRLLDEGLSDEDAKAMAEVRIFTEAPGSYGTGVSEMTSASSYWESDAEVVDVYLNRVGFAFGRGMWGRPAQNIFRQNLKDVDVAVHSRSSLLYGMLDNDDMFQYLGGLSMAVGKERGQVPDTLITDQRTPGRVAVEDVARSVSREMRTRYLNPQWIQGMQQENYAGAGEMATFMENLWGWQVTTPTAVDKGLWEQSYAVYVEDKYGQDIKAFFNRTNPWAYQSMTARMLEAVRKDYWPADETVKQKLAAEYALNVVEKGVACCDHTCNNPMLNKMVVNIISLPGVLSPEMVEKFKLAIEKMAAKPLDQQVAERKQLLAELKESPGRMDQAAEQKGRKAVNEKAQADGPADTEQVEGYKMEDMDTQDKTTDLTSSGVQWAASIFVLFVIGLFVWGTRRRRQMMNR